MTLVVRVESEGERKRREEDVEGTRGARVAHLDGLDDGRVLAG